VDLAVDRRDLTARPDQQRRVREELAPRDPLGDAAGEEVDAELPRPAPRGRDDRAIERLGAGGEVLTRGEQAPLLREDDELGAVGGGGTNEPLGGREVRIDVPRCVQLYRSRSDVSSSFDLRAVGRRLIDQSI
jgi:hypothetical protein